MNSHTKPPAAQQQDAPIYVPADVTPDELFEALGKLRREAQDEIERLIDLLDRTDGFFDEREQQIDDDPIDGDDNSEDTLGSIDAADQTRWASGYAGDREGDGCADDREGDELQHGGDGAVEDNEPSLGWTENESASDRVYAGSGFGANDLELAPSTFSKAALARHKQFDGFVNNDGMHVDAENSFGSRRRLRNLSDRQRQILRPKVDRGAVSI